MIAAIFFDFYSVWEPDPFSFLLAEAQQENPEISKQLSDIVEKYYHGEVELDQLVEAFKVKLSYSRLSVEYFQLHESNTSPEIVKFMQSLHRQFVKVGILANLGKQEYEHLSKFNEHNHMFEVIASPLTLKLKAPLLSREVFDAALKAIGEPTRSTLLVSGNLYFLQFAASLGITTIQFEGFTKLIQTVHQLIDKDDG